MKAANAPQISNISAAQATSTGELKRDRRGSLLHGYLHKTSNSLCGIKGYASLIASDVAPQPKTQRWARKILAEVETMERIYRSVQEMAFPQRVEPMGNALGATVQSAATAMSLHFKCLALEVDVLSKGRLLLPARDLELIVSELLRNSAEGNGTINAPDVVRVWVRTTCSSRGRIVLVVQDDGPGMPPDLLSQATIPFVTTKEGHLGIGLARVDTIMDMYGLAWSLQSRSRWGTTVVLDVAERIPHNGGAPGA